MAPPHKKLAAIKDLGLFKQDCGPHKKEQPPLLTNSAPIVWISFPQRFAPPLTPDPALQVIVYSLYKGVRPAHQNLAFGSMKFGLPLQKTQFFQK
jgi:hypothetical protein